MVRGDDILKVINIAVIGAGFMGKTHSYAISNLKFFYKDLPFNVCLHTVCTSNMESANRAKEEMGFLHATDNFDCVVANEEIDVIDICTPNALHAEQIIKAVRNNKHVYCEKPAVISIDEANKVKEELAKSNTVCGIVFNNRYLPATMRARLLYKEGKIGNIVSFAGRYIHASGINKSKVGWRDIKSKSGGGVLFDLGSHVLDLVGYITGDDKLIERVFGRSQIKNSNITDCDERFNIIARLKNGSLGTVEVSKIHLGTNDDLSIEIHGDKGAIKFNLMEPGYLYFYDGTAADSPYGGYRGYTRIDCVGRYEYPAGAFPSPKAPIGWLQGHVHSMYCYLNCVCNNDRELNNSASLTDALRINCIVDAAYRSDISGKEELVEYI